MFLTVPELITLLRSSVDARFESEEITDTAYLTMTDEELEVYLKLGAVSVYPSLSSLDSLNSGLEYPVLLLAKIELYSRLAVARADKIDLVADNNNQLKQSQRFSHYMNLVAEARAEYNFWVKESSSTLESVNVILAKDRYVKRNYPLTPTPVVTVTIDSVVSDTVELHWSVVNSSDFGCYRMYISPDTIFDAYSEKYDLESKISSEAVLVKKTSDIRNNNQRLSGLTPETTYHVFVSSSERNGVYGYKEITFTTLAEETGEEIDITTL